MEVLEGCSEVLQELSLLQAEHAQLPQLFFTGDVFQLFGRLCGPPLELLQQLCIILVLRGPRTTQVLCRAGLKEFVYTVWDCPNLSVVVPCAWPC